jgi:hypothetical protein
LFQERLADLDPSPAGMKRASVHTHRLDPNAAAYLVPARCRTQFGCRVLRNGDVMVGEGKIDQFRSTSDASPGTTSRM